MNVQNGGGSAAVIYNNIPGDFLGTLGAGNSSSILGMSISQENGQALVAGSLGGQATLTSVYSQPASGYDYYDGTSMATPHVSAVAALVWSAKPSATNAEIRTVLQQTAQDLGTAGRDNYYGFGLVQAKTAVDALGGGTAGTPMSVSDLDGSRTITKKNWVSTFTIEVKDNTGMLLSGVKVDGKVGTKALTCTTGADGRCNILLTNKQNLASVTFTVSNLTMSGFVYDPSSNSDVDGDSDGTSITVLKQG
jgi:subtilisin family serine protease